MSYRRNLLTIIVTFANLIQFRPVLAQVQVVTLKPQEDHAGLEKFQMQSSSGFSKHIKAEMQKWLLTPLEKGMSPQIGWVDLRKLSSEIEGIDIYFNSSKELVVGSVNRVGAVNWTESKSVVFNSSLLNEAYATGYGSVFSSMGVETIMLHEALGALGYPDENYELSTHLYMRSLPQDYGPETIQLTQKSLENFLKENPHRRVENTTFKRGTSTGVGGGGDPVSAAIKLTAMSFIFANRENLLKNYMQNEQELNDLISFIHLVKVEPQDQKTPYSLGKGIGSLSEAIKRGETAQIFVDTNLAFAVRAPRDMTNAGFRFLEVCLEILRSK